MAPKLIGVGFGHTCTLSIKGALEELGFGTCYHMRATFENVGDAPVWQAAA